MAWFSVLVPTLFLLSFSAIAITITITITPPDADVGDSLSSNAHFISDKPAVQHIPPTPSNFSLITQSTTFNSSSITSLSTNFTFQIGNGVALVIIPAHFTSNTSLDLTNVARFIRIEFQPHLCSFSVSRVRNFSKYSNVLKNGIKISAWVDYSAISKRLDVKLSKLGDPKPVKPLISYSIDLGDVFKGEKVLAGLALSNAKDHEQIMPESSTRFWFVFAGDSGKTIRGEEVLFEESVNENLGYVYSWSCEIEGDDPKLQLMLSVSVSLESSVASEFVVFATGSALAALVMFLVWSCVVDWSKAQGKTSVQPPVDFKFEKVDVVEVNKGLGTGMK